MPNDAQINRTEVPASGLTGTAEVNEFFPILRQDYLKNGVVRAGYSRLTPVQKSSLPVILQGRDVLVGAKTGSGKTAAFAIGILDKLNIEIHMPQALVLCPTRELASQVADQIRKIGSCIPQLKVVVLCGGEFLRKQTETLRFGCHVVVATPGRLVDHLSRQNLSLEHVRTFVLDEADRMLDMGFEEDLSEITSRVPSSRQTLLFSATFTDKIHQLAVSTLVNPDIIRADEEKVHSSIEQHFFKVGREDKILALLEVLSRFNPENVLIFCSMKIQTEEIKEALKVAGVRSVLTLHGDLEQRDRTQVLELFANRSCSVLVATDVAARGLDIPKLDLVVNFDLAHDPESHVHRIGRTGRSGKSGIAVSLYSEREVRKLEAIEAFCGMVFEKKQIALTKPKSSKWAGIPPYSTLRVNAGKKNKIRKGDILGALTASGELTSLHVGQISIFDFHSLIAVNQQQGQAALRILNSKPVKTKSVKAQFVGF